MSQERTEDSSSPATGQAGRIDATSARALGTNAVTQGALERAEAAVGNTGPLPKNQAQSDALTRAFVTPDGKVSTTPPEGSAVQLTGAEAEAYLAVHGGGKAAPKETVTDDAAEKASPKAANKERKSSGSRK